MMTRPCHCGKCRHCDYAENDPRFQVLWGIDPDTKKPVIRDGNPKSCCGGNKNADYEVRLDESTGSP